MVKYYYDKYNSVANTAWVDNSYWPQTSDSLQVWMTDMYKTYTFDKVTNTYSVSGSKWGDGAIPEGSAGYSIISTNQLRRVVTKLVGTLPANIDCRVYVKDPAINTKETTYSKGTLVQSGIIAENGTYPTDGRHTDGFWYVRGAVANQNPIITSNTIPIGSIEAKPSFNYTVTDPDGNTMTVTESIDGIVFNTRTGVASGSQLTFTPTDLSWLRTRIKQTVNLTIKADDGKGGVTTVNYPITRTTPAIDMKLKTPFETDVAARRLLLKLEGNISIDATVSVQACNNAFDTNPTWENATNLVLSGFPYSFTNKTKTAAKWGVSFKIRIERGNSAGTIFLDGIGGAYD